MKERPKLKRDWIGLTVKLKRDMRTVRGVIFDAGEVLKVTGYYRGLELETIHTCPHCTRRTVEHIKRVEIHNVELAEGEDRP